VRFGRVASIMERLYYPFASSGRSHGFHGEAIGVDRLTAFGLFAVEAVWSLVAVYGWWGRQVLPGSHR
jgi:hypothetical protein